MRRLRPSRGGRTQYANKVSSWSLDLWGLYLWGRLFSLPFGQFGMAGWKACPTQFEPFRT